MLLYEMANLRRPFIGTLAGLLRLSSSASLSGDPSEDHHRRRLRSLEQPATWRCTPKAP